MTFVHKNYFCIILLYLILEKGESTMKFYIGSGMKNGELVDYYSKN